MALTLQERTNIIKLTVAMFNAAPGATYLADLTVAYEANGRSLAQLAKTLAEPPAYHALNPLVHTPPDFATRSLPPPGRWHVFFVGALVDLGLGCVLLEGVGVRPEKTVHAVCGAAASATRRSFRG